jgi:hypothetical protein
MPFGQYKDFNDCVSRNQDKANPEGYCANIMRQIEGKEEEDYKKELTSDKNRHSIHTESDR